MAESTLADVSAPAHPATRKRKPPGKGDRRNANLTKGTFGRRRKRIRKEVSSLLLVIGLARPMSRQCLLGSKFYPHMVTFGGWGWVGLYTHHSLKRNREW